MKDKLVLCVFHAPSPKSIQFFLIFSITSHQLLKSHVTRQTRQILPNLLYFKCQPQACFFSWHVKSNVAPRVRPYWKAV